LEFLEIPRGAPGTVNKTNGVAGPGLCASHLVVLRAEHPSVGFSCGDCRHSSPRDLSLSRRPDAATSRICGRAVGTPFEKVLISDPAFFLPSPRAPPRRTFWAARGPLPLGHMPDKAKQHGCVISSGNYHAERTEHVGGSARKVFYVTISK